MTRNMTPMLVGADVESAFTSGEPLSTDAPESGDVFSVAEPADWFTECEGQLFNLCLLPPNWDSYGANPVDRESVGQASELLHKLARVSNIESPIVTATPDGNAAFCWDDGQRSLDLEILRSGVAKYTYLNESDDSKDEEGRTKDITLFAQLLSE